MKMPKYEKNCYTLSVAMTCGSDGYSKLKKLDESFVGTNSYMGIAYFWDHEVKHTMRDMTPKFRKIIHDALILNDIQPKNDGFGGKYFETTDDVYRIINAVLKKYKPKDWEYYSFREPFYYHYRRASNG